MPGFVEFDYVCRFESGGLASGSFEGEIIEITDQCVIRRVVEFQDYCQQGETKGWFDVRRCKCPPLPFPC